MPISPAMIKHAEYVLANFDYERVHKVMVLLNWKWASVDGDGIPTLDQIKEMARRVVYEMLENKSGHLSTCGFTAEIRTWDKAHPHIQLLFYVHDTQSSWLNY